LDRRPTGPRPVGAQTIGGSDMARPELTAAEIAARDEAYRLVAEHEAKLPPYERELFLQRLERLLKGIPATKRTVDGGCVVIAPKKFRTD